MGIPAIPPGPDNIARQLAAAKSDGYFPVACRTGATYVRDTNSAATIASRTRHILPFGAIDVIPIYAGWRRSPAEGAMTFPAAIHIGVEPVWGTLSAWDAAGVGAPTVRQSIAVGLSDLTIPSDSYLRSNPIAVNAAAGAAIGARIHVPSSTGVAASRSKSAALLEYSTVGSGTDRAWGGDYASVGGLNSAIQPLVILGRALDRQRHPSAAILGDSNFYGTISVSGGGNSFDALDADGNSGWVERSLLSQIPFSNFAAPGDRMDYLMNGAGGTAARHRSMFEALNLGYSHIINGYTGTNDALGAALSLAQVQDRWIKLSSELLGLGARMWAITPLPNTTSTDTFATLGNQTVTAGGAILQQFAAWLRTNYRSYGYEGLIDLNALVDPTLVGKWRVDLTSLGVPPTYDGVHPGQAMLTWIAGQALIAPTMFVI